MPSPSKSVKQYPAPAPPRSLLSGGFGRVVRRPSFSTRSFFSEFLQVSHNDRDQLFGLQILLGDPLNVFARHPANQVGVAVRIIHPQLEIFHLRQKACDLAVGIETQW